MSNWNWLHDCDGNTKVPGEEGVLLSPCPSHLPRWTDLEWNLVLCSERPVTDFQRNVTAFHTVIHEP
jgi:hypothetical protein